MSFDVFDKWVEGNGTRRYRPDNPNAVQQKAGNSMAGTSRIVKTQCFMEVNKNNLLGGQYLFPKI